MYYFFVVKPFKILSDDLSEIFSTLSLSTNTLLELEHLRSFFLSDCNLIPFDQEFPFLYPLYLAVSVNHYTTP